MTAASKKKKAPALEKPSTLVQVFWLPAAVFIFIAAYVIIGSTSAHNYPQQAFFVHNDVLNGLSLGCFILAGLLTLVPPLRRTLSRHLDKFSALPASTHWIGVGLCFLGVFTWLSFIKFCQYRAYLLPIDTANDINAAYTFLHHGVLEYPVWGAKILSIHFSLLMAVFSPFLLIYNHPLTLLLIQNIFIASVPFAMYCLIWLLTASSMAGAAGMILVLSIPYLYELLTSNLNAFNASLCCFLPWAMVFFYLKRWWLAALFIVLMICQKEQVPFIFFGMGLYAIHAWQGRTRWNWAAGGLICAASIGLWVAEMALISHYQKQPGALPEASTYFAMFAHLAPRGTPVDRIFTEIIGHPFRTAALTLSSQYRFFPLLRVLFSVGFLCLLAPLQMLPFWTTILPQVLATPGNPIGFFDHSPITYWDFGLHHPSYFFGPLVWATAHGIAVLHKKLSPARRQSWLLVVILFFSGFGFKYANRTLLPNWNPQWFDAAPRVMSRIPPQARLWTLEYLATPLSARRWLTWIMWGPDDPTGCKRLFKPDYVFFDKAFVVYAKPPYRDKMLTFFAQNKYEKIADDHNLILLKSPNPSAEPDADISEWMQLPAPDMKLIQDYGRYLLSGGS